jgi:hypothetical protein
MPKLAIFIPEQPEQTETDVATHVAASYVRCTVSAEHERTKPPLPVRPPRPHPHIARTAVTR